MRRHKATGIEPGGNDRSPDPGGDTQYVFAEPGSSVYAVIHGDIHIRNGFPVYQILPFPAEARQAPAGTARMQPSRLLAADAGIVPFWGREEELARLAAWRDDLAAGISAMLVHAPGGQGKTRLAARFAADSAAEAWTAWQARHLSDPGLEHVVAPGEPGAALVLIVDYAERWPIDDLGLLLGNPLLRRPERCRVLLIAREAGTWWPALRHRLFSKAGITVGPTLALAPLADSAAERRDVFTAARDSFAAVFSVPAMKVDVPRDLDQEAFQLVLTVHMAALVAVDAQARGAVAPADPVGLSGYLLDREHDFWHTLNSSGLISTPPQLLGRTAYTATLTHAQHREQAINVVQRVRIASAATAATVLDDHARCYPPLAGRSESVLEQLYPDRLGEDFVALTTPGHANPDYFPDEWARDAPALLLAPASHEQTTPPGYTRSALTVLAETAQRWPHVADQQLYPLLRARPQLALAAGGATLAAIVRAPGIDMDLLTAIEQWLPEDRHADLDLGIAVLTERLTRWRLEHATDPGEQAVLYQNLGLRLGHAGLYEQAADASSEAVRLYQQADISAPGQYTASVAEATQNYSVHLSELGRREAARAASEEAVAAFRRLSGDNPDYAASLASALDSHAADLQRLQRPDEALSVATEAVAIWRRLDAANPNAHRPDLTRGLQNLAVALGSAGHPAEALAAAQEAHQAYRGLAKDAPEQFEPGYANMLQTLASRLSALGRHEETLRITREALPLCRGLARKNPAAFEPGLAKALNNLGTTLSAVGRRDEALLYLHEAVDIYGRLAEASPAAFEPRLATAWYNLGACLARLSRSAEAIAATRQAVQIWQRLAAADPGTHRPDLADSLVSLGLRLTAIGSRDEALAVTAEAVSIWRRLAARYPASFEPELAGALDALAGRLADAGRPEEALAMAWESAAFYERLAEENPSAFEEDLAMAVHNLSLRLAESGQYDEALAASQRAADAYRRLAQAVPGRFEPSLADSLNTLGGQLGRAGHGQDALAVIEEATVIYRRLADASPEAFEPGLAAALTNLCARLSANGHKAQALPVAEEATAIYRRLVTGDGEFRPQLAAALNNLGMSLSAQGRHAEGLAATSESAAIYRELTATHSAAFEPYLARALVAVAAEHSRSLSGWQQVFAALREAVAIYRRLAVAHPAQFEDRLRRTLLSAAAALACLGFFQNATELRTLIAAGRLDKAAEILQQQGMPEATPGRRAAAAIIRRADRYQARSRRH